MPERTVPQIFCVAVVPFLLTTALIKAASVLEWEGEGFSHTTVKSEEEALIGFEVVA